MTYIMESLPDITVFTGQSCTQCSQTPENNTQKKLLRCTACKMTNYCSKECQRKDWAEHKVECKMFQLYRHLYNDIPSNNNQGCGRLNKANNLLEMVPSLLQNKQQAIENNIPSTLLPTPAQFETKFDHQRFIRFIIQGRACSICLKNEFSISPDEAKDSLEWTCCPTCHFGWCCTKDHWNEYQEKHTPEICRLYIMAVAINRFHHEHIAQYNEEFLHIPDHPLPSTLTTFPKTWEDYFSLRFANINYQHTRSLLPPPFYPAATRLLSQPVTCLSAMYQFGIEHFQNLDHLHLHVVGADVGYEVPATCVWEEILHCLPGAKHITVQFVGPGACTHLEPPGTREYPTTRMESCPDCEGKKRTRSTGMFGYTYHEYFQRYVATKKHEVPNFIIAFHTGMHEVDKASWKTSLQTILDLDVPAYFTSYTHNEAVQDFAVLESTGVAANILQDEPQPNEFREDYMTIEPMSEGRVDEFYTCNMYGTLFKGRKKK